MFLPLSSRTVLVLLGLSTVSTAALSECPPDHVDPHYQANLSYTPADLLPSPTGSLEPLYDFARLFLQAVQPYGLPLDLASQVSHSEAASSEAVGFEAGYVVCLILAVLYAVLIPVGGAVLTWRYFRNRKLKKESELPSPLPWYRRNVTVITCLSITVILLLPGVILTFTTNNRTHQNVEPNLSHIRANLWDIEEALNAVPKKVEFIIKQFSNFHEVMSAELTETGASVGDAILSSLSPDINKTLHHLDISVQDAVNAQRHLQEVRELRANMQNIYRFLQTELQQMRNRLNSLNSSINTSNLDTDANYTMIPSVNAELQRLSFVSVLDVKVQQLKTLINSIPETCSDQITPKIKAWLVRLNTTQSRFRNYSRRLPSLKSLSKAVSELRVSLEESRKDFQYYDNVRWSISAVFCILLLIITLLMLAGLVLGSSVVISPTIYPFHLQDRLRLTAVYFLYVSIGMIFLFSWLFIIMVFINLFFGGNADALACRSVHTGDIFQYLDKQDHLFSSLNAPNPDLSDTPPPTASTPVNVTSGTSYPAPDHQRKHNISTYKIVEGCTRGMSLFYSMNMDKTFKMDEFLNASLYLTGFSSSMNSLNVRLDDVILHLLLTQSYVQQFKYSSSLDQIRYNDFKALLARPVVKGDLDAFAGELEIAASSADVSTRQNLTSEVAKVRQLAEKVRLQDLYRRNMSSSIQALDYISQNYKTNADNTLLSTSETTNALNQRVPNITREVSQCMMEKGENLLKQYLEMVRYAIIEQALNCLWLPASLSNLYTATCQNLIGPWNGFWFSLGWCCAFLIPGVVFGIFAAQLWKPSSASNKEPFNMPKDIINTCMTMDHMTGKRTCEDTKETKSNIYWTLDDVMNHKGKDEKWGNQ